MTVQPEAQDVPRWLEADSEVSSQLRELALEASRLPDDGARIARLRGRLGPWLATGVAAEVLRPALRAPEAATVSAAPATGSTAIVVKAAAVALVTSVGLTSVLGLLGSDTEPRRATASSVASPPTASMASHAPPLLQPRLTPPEAKLAVEQARPVETSVGAKLSLPASPLPATSASGSSLAEQAALLSRARGLLDVAPSEALELLREHARRFPNSTLSEERRLFTIDALASAGRIHEAELELESFERSSPASPHLPRARRLLAAKSGGP